MKIYKRKPRNWWQRVWFWVTPQYFEVSKAYVTNPGLDISESYIDMFNIKSNNAITLRWSDWKANYEPVEEKLK